MRPLKQFKLIDLVFAKMLQRSLFVFTLSLLAANFSSASPNTITFQSRIIKPNGTALEATAVNFRFSITDTVGSCVIYQEDFTNRNMSGSKGLINLSMGAGSKVYPVAAMALTEVFNNYNSPTLNCQAGGNITAGATDRRKLIVQFNDGSGWQTVPAMDINSTPFALQADSALKLGDFPAADYVRTAIFPTCVGGEALYFNGASFTCVTVGGGSGTVTSVTSANGDITVTNTTTTPQVTLNSGTGINQIVKLNGSSQLPAVSGVNLTALNASNLGSGTVPATQMPALTGDVTMAAGTTATSITANVIVDGDINNSAGIARSKLATGTTNHVVVNDGITGALSSIGCANGQLIKWAAGVPTCSTDLAGVGDIINGGNATGATVYVGTTDTQSLALKTNNATAMTILSSGNVGIGTTTPTATLDLLSSSASTTGQPTGFRNSVTHNSGSNALGVTVLGINSTATQSGAFDLSNLFGESITAENAGSGTTSFVIAGDFNASNTSTGTVTNLYGLKSLAENNSANGLVNNITGIESYSKNSSSTIVNNATAGVFGVINVGSGSINTGYGIYITNINATTKYSIYASDATAPSYFAGKIGFGTTTPARLLHVAGPMKITPTVAPGAAAAGDIYVDSADANKLKYYDGSGWVTASGAVGSVTNVSSANTDIGVANGGTTPVLTLNAATTGADKILKLKNDGTLDAISGINLTNLNASNLGSGTMPAARFPTFTGDVTTAAGAVATTIATNAVTSAKILDDEIVNADINSAAAITRSKLANGTIDHVLINSAAGVMTSEAQLAISRGGTGLASYTNNALIMANVTGTALTNATCAPGELLLWSGVTWACANMAAAAQGFFKDGGNTFTGTATIGTNSNHNLEIETNGTTKMTILNTGNVGIGTSSPSSPLTISSSATNNTGIKNQIANYTDISPTANSTGQYNGIYNEVLTFSAFNVGSIRGLEQNIGSYSSGTVSTIYGRKETLSHGGAGTATATYGSYLSISKDSGSGPMTNVTGEYATITNNSNGVLTTATGLDARVGTATAGGSITTARGIQTSVTVGPGSIGTSYGLYVGAVEGTTRYSIYAGDQNAPTYLAGNVGIGTSAPNYKLDVSGSLHATGVTTLDSGIGIGTSSLGANSISIVKNAGAGGYAQSLMQNTNSAGGTGWAIQNNGPIGAFFEILGSTYSSGYASETANSVVLMSSGSNLSLVTHSAFPIQFWTNETERMRIDSSGNVGVGTTGPNAKLDVNQTVAGSAAFLAESGGTNFLKILNPAGGATITYNAANSVLYVGSDTGTGRSINASGTINASGADFAEWVDWPEASQTPQMGSVVLFKGSYVVVSSPSIAAFVGNDNNNFKKPLLVAFAGQIPVLVVGKVREGDLIVANGDGTASAISQDHVTMAQARKGVGTAWASSDDTRIKRVNVAVGIGLGGHGNKEVASVREENKKLQQENATKTKELNLIKVRLDQQQKELAAIKSKLGL